MSDMFLDMPAQPVKDLVANLLILLSPVDLHAQEISLDLVKNSPNLSIEQKLYLCVSIARGNCSHHLANAMSGMTGSEVTSFLATVERIQSQFVVDTIKSFLVNQGIFDV